LSELDDCYKIEMIMLVRGELGFMSDEIHIVVFKLWNLYRQRKQLGN